MGKGMDNASDNGTNKTTNANGKPVIPGESQITINKKWVAIIVTTTVVFTGVLGWMLQVTFTARPLSAEYLQDHPRK